VHGDAIALSPSIAIGEGQLMHAVDLLEQALERLRD
jgi:hypothetical protein